ncbi:MAG: glutaredoxin family protein [Bacillota bacterium]|nr:glutaredoxin family protein [Bacillota bacterium]
MAAKAWLAQKKVPYTELDVSRHPAAQKELLEKSGYLAVPTFEVDGRIIVGFDRSQLEKLLLH